MLRLVSAPGEADVKVISQRGVGAVGMEATVRVLSSIVGRRLISVGVV